LGLEQRGVAAITAVIIVAASVGAGAATPVIVDAVDVDPDSPFYGIERLGERIRMISDDDQMKERWGEYQRMVAKEKGTGHKAILEEFIQKMREVVPGDVAAKQDIVRWMQEQMPGICLVQLRLQEELAERLREDLKDLPEIREEIKNEIEEIENMMEMLPDATPELQENIRAHLRLIREKFENIARRYRERVGPVNVYFDIDNLLVDVDITVNVEVNINVIRPPNWTAGFENALDEFGNLLSEVQAMLEGTPENALGRHAVERLVEVAIELRDKAITAYEENRTRNALGLIHAAKMHLLNAKIILEHASEWEPEFTGQWTQWRERWQELKQELIEEGAWEDILKNYEQYAGNIRQRWEERLRAIVPA